MSNKAVINTGNPSTWIFTFTSIPAMTGTSIHSVNNMKLFLTRFTMPSIQLNNQNIDFLQLRTNVIHDPPEYTPLTVEFKIAEDFSNYLILLGWANYISNNRTNIALKEYGEDTPISTTSFLEYYDPWGNAKVKFTFTNTILTLINEVTFDYQMIEEDLICSCSFIFDQILFEKV